MNRKRCLALYAAIKGNSRNTKFKDICDLCKCVGMFLDRQEGSHQIFLHKNNPMIFANLQEDKGGMAKPYQVKQVLDKIESYGLLNGED